MSPIVTVEIPPWPAIACPVCGDISVNLDGEVALCTREDCGAGASVRAMVPAQKTEAERRHRQLHAHVVGCEYCQRASDRRGLCRTGAELRGRWLAWLIPAPAPATGWTSVRKLTDAERTELQPLFRDLHAHVETCERCAAAPTPATAAELGEANLCSVGAGLYRRWLEWLAGS